MIGQFFRHALEGLLAPLRWCDPEEMLRLIDAELKETAVTYAAVSRELIIMEHEIRTSRVENEDLFTCYVTLSIRLGEIKVRIEELYRERCEFYKQVLR